MSSETSTHESEVTNEVVSIRNLRIFTKQFQTLLSSGIPILHAIELCKDQSSDLNLKKILSEIKIQVSHGAQLWESMKRYPKAFNKVYVSLVKAGESSGKLDTILIRLASDLDRIAKLKSMVQNALFYPFAVIVVGVLILIAMMTFVVPKIEELILQSGQELPWITEAVLGSARWISAHFLFLGVILSAFFIFSTQYFKSKEGFEFFQRVSYQIPWFGKMIQKAALARFARLASLLIHSGVPLLQALELSRSGMDQVVLEEKLEDLTDEIQKGRTLSQALNSASEIPKILTQMTAIGEQTGELDKMLERTAGFFEEDLEENLLRFSKILEPALIALLGLCVVTLLIALYLPIFQVAGGGK